jgi:peptide/nickel transport system permease protein
MRSRDRGDFWIQFRRSKLATAAVLYLGLLIFGAVFAPIFTSDPDRVQLDERLQPPSARHWLGTDDLGRDVLARIVHGSRVTLAVSLAATAIAVGIGVTLGALAGYYSGAVDWLVSRLIEVVLCFPFLFLLLAIVALFKPSMMTIIVALSVTTWPSEARLVRGEMLRVREIEFAEAARASGARTSRLIIRHLLPNAIAPVLVSASFGVASVMLIESALSFLGFGVPLPRASWGSILSTADDYLLHAWWLALFPGLAIFLTAAAYNVIGDRLRDALDPRSDRRHR